MSGHYGDRTVHAMRRRRRIAARRLRRLLINVVGRGQGGDMVLVVMLIGGIVGRAVALSGGRVFLLLVMDELGDVGFGHDGGAGGDRVDGRALQHRIGFAGVRRWDGGGQLSERQPSTVRRVQLVGDAHRDRHPRHASRCDKRRVRDPLAGLVHV